MTIDGPDGLVTPASAVRATVARAYREHGAKMHAALVRRFHDLDVAEEALQEAMMAALEQWPRALPRDPVAWLVRAAFHKAIDRLRRTGTERRTRDAFGVDERATSPDHVAAPDEPPHDREPYAKGDAPPDSSAWGEDGLAGDDRLRLVFLCCHPALPFEARVALTLRTVSCLTTTEIARAFLVPEATMAQRLVRAKAKIRDARVPFRTPGPGEIDERIEAVLAVVYLVFNEGYAATAGPTLVREDLCAEALRLARLLVDLVPTSGPAAGLRALLLLTDARRSARIDSRGDLVLLEDQDRSIWNAEQTARGLDEVTRAITAGPALHPYTLQAAIAGVHARSATARETDWREIAALYELLAQVAPSAVVSMNHAVAVAMCEGPEAGLARLDALVQGGALEREHLFHASRADLLRRAGRIDEARSAYARALTLVTNEAERRFLTKRAASLSA